MNVKDHAWIVLFAALMLASCGVSLPVDGTVTTLDYRWKPPSGWSTVVGQERVVAVSAGDAAALETDLTRLSTDQIAIFMTPTQHLGGVLMRDFAPQYWRTVSWLEGGGDSVAPVDEWLLPSVAPVTLGELSGVQYDALYRSMIRRRYMLELTPEIALEVSIYFPPDHPGLEAVLQSLETLKRVPAAR